MVEKILNNTTPYGKIRALHEGLLHSSTLSHHSSHPPTICCLLPIGWGAEIFKFLIQH